MSRTWFALLTISALFTFVPVHAQGPSLLGIPAGKSLTVQQDTGPIPLGPIEVRFPAGWEFVTQRPRLIGRLPTGDILAAEWMLDPLTRDDQSQRQLFLREVRQRILGRQAKWMEAFGTATKPCTEEQQSLGRFRYLCAAQRISEGKLAYLVFYTYVGRYSTVSIQMSGPGEAALALERAESMFSDARWIDDPADAPSGVGSKESPSSQGLPSIVR